MMRTTQRTLGFESMEGRVLLSTWIGHHGHHHAMGHGRHAMIRRDRASVSHVMLNGVLRGIPFGSAGQGGITVTSFEMKGRSRSLGHVNAALELNNNLIAPGQQPDLSNATLTLSNHRGSVQIKTAASPSNRYIFIVMSGTGAYASAYGSGTAAVGFNRRLHEFQVVLRSALH